MAKFKIQKAAMFVDHIRNFNTQLTMEGLVSKDLDKLAGDYDAVVIAGMGGSGLPGEIIGELAGGLNVPVPVYVWHDYGLPKSVEMWAKKPLVIAVSFSGETEETLNVFDAVRERGYDAAAVSGNPDGALHKKAESKNLPRVSFAPYLRAGEGLTPRTSCGYMFYSCVLLLSRCFELNIQELALADAVDAASLESGGKDLAEKLKGGITLIYAHYPYGALGRLWKANINETAKLPAFSYEVPELAHNEIAAFSGESGTGCKFNSLFLIDESDELRAGKAGRIAELLKGMANPNIVKLRGNAIVERMWNGAVLGLWTSYYLAELLGSDPEKVELIERLKGRNQQPRSA